MRNATDKDPSFLYIVDYSIKDLFFLNSCLWNLCSFGLVYSIDWVRQRLDIFSF